MESSNPEQLTGAKRKRSPVVDAAARQLPPPAGSHPGNFTQLNYMIKAKTERLRLIQGDVETFGEVLGVIDDYEGKLRSYCSAVTANEMWRLTRLRCGV